MPRRIPDYPDAFLPFNEMASYGSILTALSTVLFFFFAIVLGLNLDLKRISAFREGPSFPHYWGFRKIFYDDEETDEDLCDEPPSLVELRLRFQEVGSYY